MPASSKEFLDIQQTTECGFTLKRLRDMTRTYSTFMGPKRKNTFKIYKKILLADFSEVACDGSFVWTFFEENWHLPYFLCHFFVIHDRFSTRIESPLSTVNCFQIKLLQIFWEVQLSHALLLMQNKNYNLELSLLHTDNYLTRHVKE